MNSQARPLLIKAIETGDFSELVDSRLEKHYVEHEVFRMIETAAACVRHSGPKRPRMMQVNTNPKVQILHIYIYSNKFLIAL